MRVNPPSLSEATPDAAPAATGAGTPVATLLGAAILPAAVAVTAGGVVLVVAIAWGAAEAAVGVGAAYLVYNAFVGGGDLSGQLAVRLLTGVLRRAPAPSPDDRGAE